MQDVTKVGLRPPDWPETVEGTYLRIDIPVIVPVLLRWLERRHPGELPGHYLVVNNLSVTAQPNIPCLPVLFLTPLRLKPHCAFCFKRKEGMRHVFKRRAAPPRRGCKICFAFLQVRNHTAK